MPACTPAGAESSTSVAGSSGRSPPDTAPQPPMSTARAQRSRSRTPGIVATDGPARHLLADPDALAVEDVPLLLQVLRVRDAPGAPARAGRGGADPGRRAPPSRQGA